LCFVFFQIFGRFESRLVRKGLEAAAAVYKQDSSIGGGDQTKSTLTLTDEQLEAIITKRLAEAVAAASALAPTAAASTAPADPPQVSPIATAPADAPADTLKVPPNATAATDAVSKATVSKEATVSRELKSLQKSHLKNFK
jgi:hypothetical protein